MGLSIDDIEQATLLDTDSTQRSVLNDSHVRKTPQKVEWISILFKANGYTNGVDPKQQSLRCE